jgi:dihydrofolate reductase
MISLDGVFEGPVRLPFEKFTQAGWTEGYSSAEQMEYVSMGISSEGKLLLGRVTYEYFERSWTPQTGPVADFMNNATKYVVSNNLKKADWNSSKLISGNTIETIKNLKQESGDLVILGSGALIRSLMDCDLIDEMSLLVYPIVLGTGKHLLGDQNRANLNPKETRSFKSGVTLLVYETERKM